MSLAEAPTISSPAYFERLAAAEFAHWWPGGMWRLTSHWLDRTIRGRVGLRALDVGCGSGGAAARLARREEIAHVVGLDISPTALELAARYDLPLLRGDALGLPFYDGSFDVVTSFDVMQHLEPGDDLRAAVELRRVLRPGGVALIRANGRGLWPSRRSGARLYRLDELVGVVRASGLAVRAATYANCLPSVAQEVAGRLRQPAPTAPRSHPAGGGLCLRVPPPWINRLMAGVAAAEALAAGRLGARLPVGHSTMVMAIRVTDDK
jgi:SAM-dependent methyltransferase